MSSTLAPVRPNILLVTLNAKFIHASLGLRYLYANMGNLQAQTRLREFTIARPAQEIVNALLAELSEEATARQFEHHAPIIIGFGVYIWNVVQTTTVIRLLKARRPDIKIILGGPEVSYEHSEQDIVKLADFVITGWGDISFAKLCRSLLYGPRPLNKIIAGEQAPLAEIALPYDAYSDADLAHRLLYVEASRGCPYKCEFCLSSLDKTAWAFDLDAFLDQMDSLYRRGARNFKFVDRTFNLKIDASIRILQFFLERLATTTEALFVHFEVIPDYLPDRLKTVIAQFPPGVLQFEVGIQTFNVDVQLRISRKQDNIKTEANLRWLLNSSNAHLHTDLIFGLPGETLESFAAGFDRLYALKPHEIQLGILKRLRGTPITRHTDEYGMVYDPAPPYTVLQTRVVDTQTMQQFTRLARYWELIANSGRFNLTLPLIMECEPANLSTTHATHSPFFAFWALSHWLWGKTSQTSTFTPESLTDALGEYLLNRRGTSPDIIIKTLLADYVTSGARGSPTLLKGLLPRREAPVSKTHQLAHRQERHVANRAAEQ